MLDSTRDQSRETPEREPVAPPTRPDIIARLLSRADIRVNGHRPWDMQVHHPDTFARILAGRSLGLGEAYMDGWWDCEALDEFFFRLVRARGDRLGRPPALVALQWLGAVVRNRQSLRRSGEVAHRHYDLDNELFSVMLDASMTYSCGYWRNAQTLHEAQLAKFDLICRKLRLEPGMRVLDIGCGWGGFLEYAARHHGVHIDGVTVSVEQAEYAQRRCADLPAFVQLRDYREVRGQYDRVVSIGMFEHVGRRNYPTFMRTTARLLKPDGLMLLHTIGCNQTRRSYDPWIDKYIFPNGELPSIAQIGRASEDVLVAEDLHNFGPDYARTLMAWHDNFEAGWQELRDRYDERFRRMWRYYLNACAGAFRARGLQLWQWVFSRPGGRLESYTGTR